jgi:hypothetical protein
MPTAPGSIGSIHCGNGFDFRTDFGHGRQKTA